MPENLTRSGSLGNENVIHLAAWFHHLARRKDSTFLKSLNRAGARYIVISGIAMVVHGFNRRTEDIDLLVDGTVENIARLYLKKILSGSNG